MDPNNVLIRCPAGHALQAGRTDLGKVLCCPVCNATFSPAGAAGPAGPASGGDPAPLGYASGMLRQPVSRPAYTLWMVGLWVVAQVLSILSGIVEMTTTQNPQKLNPAAMLTSCCVALAFIPAVVLQLMWIYRIHTDALRARAYHKVSPGLALGLSFIPVFNLIWTGWTMKTLATFAAEIGERQEPGRDDGERAATVCFYFGIAMALSQCIGAVAGGVVFLEFMSKAGPIAPGAQVDPFAAAGPGFYVLTALTWLVSLIAVLVYAWAVPKVQNALYGSLGAPA